MKNLFILVCILAYITSYSIDLRPLGFSSTTGFCFERITYMFVHIKLAHLLINLFSFNALFRILSKTIRANVLFTAMILAAVAATFGSEGVLPTVGASGVVFFLFGVYSVLYFSKPLLLFILADAVLNVVSFYFANTNIYVHAFSYAYGIAFILLFKAYYRKWPHKSTQRGITITHNK